ncbi:MAG: DUF1254 domain-containing protein [Pseudomonadota bacterium]
MIRSLLLPAGVFAVVAAISHMITLSVLPSVIMKRAVDLMAERGVPLHAFALVPRSTPETQSVVRTSPDVAYSVCRFDLSDGPVLVQGTAWNSYGSLNVYDGQTDNIFGIDLGPEQPRVIGTVLSLDRDKDQPVPDGLMVHVLKDPKGIALIRRLSPTDEHYLLAEQAADGDVCRPL